MLKVLYFNAKFSDIGLMPIKINTYRSDAKKAIADYITGIPAGSGAVRELCDLLLMASGKYVQLLAEFQPDVEKENLA